MSQNSLQEQLAAWYGRKDPRQEAFERAVDLGLFDFGESKPGAQSIKLVAYKPVSD